ncbi:MAG: hypothetical protein JWQ37_2942 [Blastococcus sp.]|jgi:hypothetical protein|nr:hypothetical protein [Blastococcus sp.]
MKHISQPSPLVVRVHPSAVAHRTARFTADEQVGSGATR